MIGAVVPKVAGMILMGARGSMISAAKVARSGQTAGDDDDVGVDDGHQACQRPCQAHR